MTDGPFLRVLTVNLLNGEADPQDLDRALAAADPDVVLAQELASNSAEVLERRFRHGVVKPGMDYRGKAMVAQFPISVEEVDFTFRPLLRGVAQLNGSPIEIFNVHLANPIDGPTGKFKERRGQVRDLEALLPRDGRAHIVGGDFNSSPAWPAYRRITRHVDDAVAEWAKAGGRRTTRTWGWRPGWPAMLRIDHIFVKGFRASQVDVVGVRGTDHRAVSVDLEPT